MEHSAGFSQTRDLSSPLFSLRRDGAAAAAAATAAEMAATTFRPAEREAPLSLSLRLHPKLGRQVLPAERSATGVFGKHAIPSRRYHSRSTATAGNRQTHAAATSDRRVRRILAKGEALTQRRRRRWFGASSQTPGGDLMARYCAAADECKR